MEFFAFLTSHGPTAMTLQSWPGSEIEVSPRLLGLFTAIFWTSLSIWANWKKPATPLRPYIVLIGYSVGSTLAYAFFAHFRQVDLAPPVAYTMALFAGAGIGAFLSIPVLSNLFPAHAVGEPIRAKVLVGIPIFLIPFMYFPGNPVAGFFLVGSSLLGLCTAFFLINCGISASLNLSARGSLVSALTLVFPELLCLSLLPAIISAIS